MIKNIDLSHAVGMALQNRNLDHDSKIKIMAEMKTLALESIFLSIAVFVIGIFLIGLSITNYRLRKRLSRLDREQDIQKLNNQSR